MSKLSKIYEGWKNSLLPSEHLKETITQTSSQRLAICRNCDWHSKNRKGYVTLRVDDHCTACGCTLSAKTACLSCNCGLETYNEKNDTDFPLKWKAVVNEEEYNTMKGHGK